MNLSTIRILDSTRHRYVSIRDVVRDARALPRVCHHPSANYLECVTEYNRVNSLAKESTRVLRLPEPYVDPQHFLEVIDRLYDNDS